MNDYEDLMSGLLWLILGAGILQNRQWLIQAAIDSGNATWGRIGVPQASEKSRRLVGKLIITFVGGFLMFAGGLLIFSFLTGRELPSRWEDLWPF